MAAPSSHPLVPLGAQSLKPGGAVAGNIDESLLPHVLSVPTAGAMHLDSDRALDLALVSYTHDRGARRETSPEHSSLDLGAPDGAGRWGVHP